jgi:hypothetical protein
MGLNLQSTMAFHAGGRLRNMVQTRADDQCIITLDHASLIIR